MAAEEKGGLGNALQLSLNIQEREETAHVGVGSNDAKKKGGRYQTKRYILVQKPAAVLCEGRRVR